MMMKKIEKKDEGTYDLLSGGIDNGNSFLENGHFPVAIYEKLASGNCDRHFL